MAILNPDAGAPYRVPPEPSRLPSILLALAMHAVLLFFLWAGVNWQSTPPVSVEAEVWDMQTEAAAPPPPPPVAQPEPEPAPKPEPRPEPPPPPPVKTVEPPAAPKPDIALERKKKEEKAREQKLAEEKIEREKEELKKKEQEKKLLAEQKAKELAEKKAAEKAEKLAKAKQAAAEEKKMAQLRAAEMQRITGAAGSGEAARSTAPRVDSGYLASIVSKIKSSTSYLGNTDVPGNPRVVFKIEELPTGEIISVRKVKSSGLPDFDEAVEKGIMKSSPLPKKKDGTVERTLEIGFSMKDLN